MINRISLYATVILIAILAGFLVIILTKMVTIGDALPIGISILALIFSIIASFKNEIFPFHLSTYIEGLYLVTAASFMDVDSVTIHVLLPINFFNRGYSEGIVEKLYLSVKFNNEESKYTFLPAYEIDMTAFIQQNKGINASNVLSASMGFLMEGKHGLKKNIIFIPTGEDSLQTFSWKPGLYHFDLYVKIHGEKKPRVLEAITQDIGPKALDMLASKKVASLFFMSQPAR